jgi:hypothetical protein
MRIHVTADERYTLFLGGKRIGRGSERGVPNHWFYETYDLSIPAGEHTLVARTWALGDAAPAAQFSVTPGFLLAAEGDWQDRLSTGIAAWECRLLPGYSTLPYVGWKDHNAEVVFNGNGFPWNYQHGEGDGWVLAETRDQARAAIFGSGYPDSLRILTPAALPPMLDQPIQGAMVRHVADIPHLDTSTIPLGSTSILPPEAWQALLSNRGAVTIPSHTIQRALIDLQSYYCVYPELVVSGGAGGELRARWAEALFTQPDPHSPKRHRDDIDGRYFFGIEDVFYPDGGDQRRLDTLWWQAGRYVELVVKTAGEPLTIERLTFNETRYPLELESAFTSSDDRLDALVPILVRGVQMCSHETLMDCPYYEQIQWAGDARIEALAGYTIASDARLARKALILFDQSRLPMGWTQVAYPTRGPGIIPGYCLWWVAMVHDYALWRDDLPLVKQLMPGVRATMEAFQRVAEPGGLIDLTEGWNFHDWVPGWVDGMPPGSVDGPTALLNWNLVLVLDMLAELEDLIGEPELAARARRQAASLAKAATDAFWDDERGLLADAPTKQHFSEHVQCLALLSGRLDPDKRARVAAGLLEAEDLARTTIYFSFYLFETYRLLGRMDQLFERLELWFGHLDLGLYTPLERPEPSRSDCHAWSSHPLFHQFATILGIRPASPGFATVEIRPQLGPLTHASGRLVHPQGEILADFQVADGTLHGSVTLPDGVSGRLIWDGQSRPLGSGFQRL